MVRRWEQFETDLASHKTWIGEVTKQTWNKKEGLESMDQLVELRNGCKRTFNDILNYEKHISDFLFYFSEAIIRKFLYFRTDGYYGKIQSGKFE